MIPTSKIDNLAQQLFRENKITFAEACALIVAINEYKPQTSDGRIVENGLASLRAIVETEV